jgi:cysteine desulfurase
MTGIYLDYNATAPMRSEVRARMQMLMEMPYNPSSVHGFGREAKKHLEHARSAIAQTIGAFPNEIIFTGSGTEANNLAFRGTKAEHVFVSAIEHSSVLKVRDAVQIPVTADGLVDAGKLAGMLADRKASLVSVMLANNETGVIQPIAEIATICKKHGALLHCDAVQALGKIPVDFGLLGVDMLTLSAHKCGGPLGAAALVIKQNLAIEPLLRGGSQELGRRAGTENLAAIAGFAEAVERVDFVQMKTLRGWLDEMEKNIEAAGGQVFGKSAPRLPNTSCIAMPGIGNEVQLMDFDLNGFAVSAGSACSSGRIEPSHVLAAMGAGDAAKYAVRVSGGWQTKQPDISGFLAVWKNLRQRLKAA